jgi:intein/homing endonuclease
LLKNRTRYHAFSWIKAGFAYLPISQLNKEKYNGEVYNIAVENTNSYVTPSATVHNCDAYFYSGKEVV